MRSENSQHCCTIASLAAWLTGSGDEPLSLFAESTGRGGFLYLPGLANLTGVTSLTPDAGWVLRSAVGISDDHQTAGDDDAKSKCSS